MKKTLAAASFAAALVLASAPAASAQSSTLFEGDNPFGSAAEAGLDGSTANGFGSNLEGDQSGSVATGSDIVGAGGLDSSSLNPGSSEGDEEDGETSGSLSEAGILFAGAVAAGFAIAAAIAVSGMA